MIQDNKWWKDATVYQIWPASYKDSNGDGVGDIPGIISTLDYIKNLGVDVIWLSPMYDSPQEDMGYDISDYTKVYPKYGTMEEMDQLIKECHDRGLKLVLDLVINHTSDKHKWFQESRSSKTNPKRDWYIWKKPRYDADGNRKPPTNWISYFSGSTWEYDELTDEYYLHMFAIGQPDLNWENEETRKAIYEDALRFWYEKGVDGFRIDTAGMYSKKSYEDAPIVFPDSEWQPCKEFHQNGPRIHEFHKEMVEQVTGKYDVMTVGEVGHGTREENLKYVSAKEKEMNMIFLFDLVELGSDPRDRFAYKGYKLSELKKAIENQSVFLEGTDGWLTTFSENHDQPRSVTRFGNDSDEWRVKSGKLIAMMIASLTGTLYLYQGQEIGMTNVPKDWDISEYKDINSINYYAELVKKYGDDKEKLAKFMETLNLVARDNARSPVQWDSSPHAGFTTGTPWTRVNDNYPKINAADQVNDPTSNYSFWVDVLKVRKSNKSSLIYGKLEVVDFENEEVFSYFKESDDGKHKSYVVLNFTDKSIPFKSLAEGKTELLISNQPDLVEDTLSPYEGRIYKVQV